MQLIKQQQHRSMCKRSSGLARGGMLGTSEYLDWTLWHIPLCSLQRLLLSIHHMSKSLYPKHLPGKLPHCVWPCTCGHWAPMALRGPRGL
jgi:hypothetical protein